MLALLRGYTKKRCLFFWVQVSVSNLWEQSEGCLWYFHSTSETNLDLCNSLFNELGSLFAFHGTRAKG